MKTISHIICTLAALYAAHLPCKAAVTVFQGNLAAFTAVAGTLPVIDFDDIALETDLKSMTIRGITFTNTLANPLKVVEASSTFTAPGFFPGGDSDNRLFATTGNNVLSPGGAALVPGPNPGQQDSLCLTFAAPERELWHRPSLSVPRRRFLHRLRNSRYSRNGDRQRTTHHDDA